MWTSTCEEVVGRKTVQHKEWITPATLQKIRIRKDKKAGMNNSRTMKGSNPGRVLESSQRGKEMYKSR